MDPKVMQQILDTVGAAAGSPTPNTAVRQTRANTQMIGDRAEAHTMEAAGDNYGSDGSLRYQSEHGIQQMGPDFAELPFEKAMQTMGLNGYAQDGGGILGELWNAGDLEVRDQITNLLLNGAGMLRGDDAAGMVMDDLQGQ